jgi:hypothetical protein
MMIEEMQEQRLRAWEETLARFSRVVDGVGCPIDPGILETVVALNLLSISTTMSCEGHAERPETHPWVEIGVIDNEERQTANRAYTLHQKANNLPIITEEAAKLIGQAETLRKQILPRHRAVARKLFPYLEAFYCEHTCDIYSHLIIRAGNYMGRCRLQPQGAFLFEDGLLSQGEHEQLLHAFQAEVQVFTTFLKQRYLNGQIIHQNSGLAIEKELL